VQKLLVSAVLVLASSTGTLAANRRPVVALQPYGPVDATVIACIAADVRARFNVDVVVRAARGLPSSAFYAPRNRYRAERLLDDLDRASDGALRIVGITGVDISTSTDEHADWGVYGLSEFEGQSGVVSTYRLARGSKTASTLDARIAKAVTHELGHMFGAEHCTTQGCVMADAEGSIRSVDAGDGRFCPVCLARLGAIARRETATPTTDAVAKAVASTPESSRNPSAAPGPPAARQ
jgi:archaemetzincin